AAAAGRPALGDDLIRNDGRVRGRTADSDGQSGTLAGGVGDRAVVGRDQNVGLGPPVLHDLSLPLPGSWRAPDALPVDLPKGSLRKAGIRHVRAHRADGSNAR